MPTIEITADASSIQVTTHEDLSAYTAYVTIEYTKDPPPAP